MNVNPSGLVPLLDEKIRRLKNDKPTNIMFSFVLGVALGILLCAAVVDQNNLVYLFRMLTK